MITVSEEMFYKSHGAATFQTINQIMSTCVSLSRHLEPSYNCSKMLN